MTKAKEFQLDKIRFLIDSLEVVRAIKGTKDWILRSFVMDILAKTLVSFKIRHFSRTLNVAAHSITKFCFKFNETAEILTLLRTG